MTSLNEERLQEICTSIREQLFRKGTRGLSGVARVFRSADFNGNKKLDREEFEEALSFCGLFLKTHEISFLFKNFDRDNDGNIAYDELLNGIQQPLSGSRLAITKKAFVKMDNDGSGVVDINDVAKVYNASQHPDVREGKKTAQDILLEFIGRFERGTKDGKITFGEFAAYYQDLGSSIPSDEYFVTMMTSVWKLSAAKKNKASPVEKWVRILKKKVKQKTKTGQRLTLTLKGIFDFFDGDESGAITEDEFSQALLRMGLPLNKKQIAKFFAYFAGADGRISTKEFIDKMDLDE